MPYGMKWLDDTNNSKNGSNEKRLLCLVTCGAGGMQCLSYKTSHTYTHAHTHLQPIMKITSQAKGATDTHTHTSAWWLWCAPLQLLLLLLLLLLLYTFLYSAPYNHSYACDKVRPPPVFCTDYKSGSEISIIVYQSASIILVNSKEGIFKRNIFMLSFNLRCHYF